MFLKRIRKENTNPMIYKRFEFPDSVLGRALFILHKFLYSFFLLEEGVSLCSDVEL